MNRFQVTIISLFMLAIFSCDKSEPDKTGSIYGKWAVTDFISVESISYPMKDGFNPVIEIKIDGTYNLKLDMNSCMGNFTLSDPNMISFSIRDALKFAATANSQKSLPKCCHGLKLFR